MRILVIEDDPVLHHILSKRLKEEGHSVDDCYDGEAGFDYADAMQYDCIVLDLMLPKRDGLSLLRDLRSRGNASPVLILTARDAIDDRVAGLDAGADDYLVKPFAFDELLARVRALLRRQSEVRNPVLKLGDLVMDTASKTVERGGRKLLLTSKEYALLEYLLRHQGQTLTRSQISDRVRALLRRGSDTKSAVLSLEDLTLNTTNRKVTRAGQDISLTSTEYALLEYLLRNQGQVLTRSQIADHVWNYDFSYDSNVVDVYIRYLRNKIDRAFPTKLIHTIRGTGYTLRVAP